jgi:N6-adenosine-specific RNA methylase IME4
MGKIQHSSARTDLVVQKLGAARLALSQAKTIQDAKKVVDVASAMGVYAKRQKLGQEAIDFARAVMYEALRRVGELLKAGERNTGAKGTARGRDVSGNIVLESPEKAPPTLADLGVTPKLSSLAQNLEKLPAKQFAEVIEGTKTPGKAIREMNRAEKHRARTIDRDWPKGEYGVILCDPPWQPDKGLLDPSREIENQYPTMPLDEIVGLAKQVKRLSASDCVLLMWVVTQKLAEAMQVMEAWGFTHKSGAVWVKSSIGMGYWFRSRHELLLLGTRGRPATPLEADRPDSVMEWPRRAHSQKPDGQYPMIDRMFPGVPKIELFARTCAARPKDWATWGNEEVK